MTWKEFYKSRVTSVEYENYFIDKYSIFLDTLDCQVGKSFLEVGCGTGLVTKLIYHPKRTFTLMDKDREMLGLAQDRLRPLPISYICKDIRIPLHQKYDVIYSHGVLEHLSLTECKRIIRNQLSVSNTLVHYVPTDGYKTPSFGDENLLPKEVWDGTLSPTKSIAFNEFKDLLLIWEKGKDGT